MHDTSEPSMMELIFDQLEELIVTLVEEVRERPSVAAAIVAGLVGAVVGSALAARASRSRHAPPPKQIAKKVHGMADTGDLLGLGMRLVQNPIVRGYVTAMVSKQLKNRFTM
jgi:hypothetical protein